MQNLLLTFFLLFFALQLDAQNKVFKQYQEDDKIQTSYHLYPSTMRMLNLNNDPDFDDLVRPIRKMSFLQLKKDVIQRSDLRMASEQIMTERDCETYIEVDGPDNAVFVIGNSDKAYTCVLAYTNEEYYLGEIKGMIDILELSKLYEKMMTADSTSELGFLNIVSIFSDDTEYRREREERERLGREKWEAEKAKRDSIEALEPKVEGQE